MGFGNAHDLSTSLATAAVDGRDAFHWIHGWWCTGVEDLIFLQDFFPEKNGWDFQLIELLGDF